MYEDLWRHHAARKPAAWRMDTFTHQRKTIDKYWQRTAGRHTRPEQTAQRPVLVYGSGSVMSRGLKGRGAAPTKLMKALARNHFKVIMVGEYKTTIVCNDCRSDTVKVYRRKFTGPPPGQSRRVEVRGLRRCRSNDCRAAAHWRAET